MVVWRALFHPDTFGRAALLSAPSAGIRRGSAAIRGRRSTLRLPRRSHRAGIISATTNPATPMPTCTSAPRASALNFRPTFTAKVHHRPHHTSHALMPWRAEDLAVSPCDHAMDLLEGTPATAADMAPSNEDDDHLHLADRRGV